MSVVRRLSAARGRLAERGAIDAVNAAGGRWVLSAVNALDVLAILHATDKSSRLHRYTRYYARHFGPQRLRAIRMLEIGVGGHDDPRRGGNSLRMWRDYFPRARVVGLDLFEKRLPRLGSRVTVVRGDQSDPDDLDRVLAELGTPDVVVDDGSHVGRHVWASFQHLWPRLEPGAWYAVEDLHTSYVPEFEGSPDGDASTAMGLVRSLADSVQALDPNIELHPQWAPEVPFEGVAELHVYPGVMFVRKAAASPPQVGGS